MTRSPVREAFIIAILFVLSMACAQEGFPPGGPQDTFPPDIVSTTPETGTTDVPLDVSPVFVFNERMDERSVEESIFISPVTPFELDTNWGGNAFTIRFEAPLVDDRTYVITMASGARDVRGNAMTGSVVLALSTGAGIDQGEISGVVASGGRTVVGAYVWAYNLRTSEDPDPGTMLPDYIGQTGQDGRFNFTNLSPGQYRIFAFLDRGRDRRYNAGQDLFAVPTSDVTLTSDLPIVQNRRFNLALRDTTSLVLLSARADHISRIVLRFSKPLDYQNISNTASYRISASDGSAVLPVVTAYPAPMDSASIVLVTAPQTAGQAYQAGISGLVDRSGNPLEADGVSASFSGSGEPDVTPAELMQTVPADSAGDVLLASDIRFTFNETVRTDSDAIMLYDQEGQPVGTTLLWDDSVRVRLDPASTLSADMEYTVRVLTGRIRDWAGNVMNLQEGVADTLQVTFNTVDPADFGMVTGAVTDERPDGAGEIIISLTEAADNRNRHTTGIPSPGAYRFDALLPGLYLVFAYRDVDGDGRLSSGSAIPFIPAEHTAARTDTILVRSGWESEQVDLVFDP